MLLWIAPATPAQLERLSSDPSAVGAILHGDADPDRDLLRWGARCALGSGWHVLDFVLTDGDRDPDPRRGFLLRGGERIGDLRAHRAADVPAIAASIGALRPDQLRRRFDRPRMRERGVWFHRLADVREESGLQHVEERLAGLVAVLDAAALAGRGILVAPSRKRTEVLLTVHLVRDEGVERYRADPEQVEAHLAAEAAPTDRFAAWYALQVALAELGSSPEHTFLQDGGEVVDEALLLRVFSPEEVGRLAALTAALAPEVVSAALSDEVARAEGLEPEDREGARIEYPRLRAHLASFAAAGRGLVTLLVG
jgi:hypothetical protein